MSAITASTETSTPFDEGTGSPLDVCEGCGKTGEPLTLIIGPDEELPLIWACPICAGESRDAEHALTERVDAMWRRHDEHANARRVCLGHN